MLGAAQVEMVVTAQKRAENESHSEKSWGIP